MGIWSEEKFRCTKSILRIIRQLFKSKERLINDSGIFELYKMSICLHVKMKVLLLMYGSKVKILLMGIK